METSPSDFCNPVIGDQDGRDHGDPFVLAFQNAYYLYHTGKEGIHLYQSADLVHWQYCGIVLQANPAADHWAQYELWAPEVLYNEGVFLMYVAGTKRLANGKGDDQARRLGIARSASPTGPFVWDDQPLVPWEWSIDGHPFRANDGSLWLFYNIRTEASRYPDGTTGCGNVVDRLLTPDQLEGRQAKVTFPDHRWEGNAEGTWYWNEGPCVLQRHGLYYQMYSGGCYRDGTYAVGYATAPEPRGPWTKYAGNPILHSREGILGPGHHCVVKAPDGVTPYIVYHGYLPGQKGRKVHIDRLFWAGDRLLLVGPTVDEQPLPPGPVYDEHVPYWQLLAWVQAAEIRLSAAQLTLSKVCHQVRAVCADQLRIWVDGIPQYTGPAEGVTPDLQADGDVRSLAITSWLDDERVHMVPAGEQAVWLWGGNTDVEVSMAVRGQAVVETYPANGNPAAVEAYGGYQHIRFTVAGGMERLVVQAGTSGAYVTDVVITAREHLK